MNIVHVQKTKPVERKFKDLEEGSFFLHLVGGLNQKIQGKAFNQTTKVVSHLAPDELVGLVEVEIRYSEVCELQDEEAEKLNTENLRLAACKRALSHFRAAERSGGAVVPSDLTGILKEAVGPEWLE